MEAWFSQSRFEGITRLYSPRQVVEQRGTIASEYPVARAAAEGLYARLRELFAERKQITTFGPYSPGQAVTMKRNGIEGIYLGGWATSAKGSTTEDPGPDLASYPLSQVPDEAATLVRALLTADRNQRFARARMTPEEREATPEYDFRPFIIADADTGHGGEAHVRNLVRRFVEVGVPGYHIEDQKPGVKKCGHQGGKVLVAQDEQIKRLNSARFQLDIMQVPGLIVARTDAEAATYLDGRGDERDQPFILGATNTKLPSFKTTYMAIQKRFYESDVTEINGHLMFRISNAAYAEADKWLTKHGVMDAADKAIAAYKQNPTGMPDKALDEVMDICLEEWQKDAALKTYGEAVADAMTMQADEGAEFDMSIEEWNTYSMEVSQKEAAKKAREMGITLTWDCELPRTPEGYYQIRGGIEYAIAKSLAAAPFADLVWMETKTANLAEAKEFAEAIHAVYPDKLLAYNLSPSFNWDTTGMTEDEMRAFPEEIGKLGYVFNFITYGGHQIDGLASEEFSTALKEDGMLALARLQRKLRLINSPYSTPQSHVGGPRLDAALMASSGRSATTKAMGKGSTHFQHLIQTEVPTKLLEKWLAKWTEHYDVPGPWRVQLRPNTAGADLLALNILDADENKVASIVFTPIQDRRGHTMLSVRDQNIYDEKYRQKRITTLLHAFMIHRYKAVSVHYVSPNEDNTRQAERMKELGMYDEVHTEIGHIIVAHVNGKYMEDFLANEDESVRAMISKQS